jgi:hypothetical protein
MARAIERYSGPKDTGEVLTPEIVDPRIADVEALARWLDYVFVLPGGFRYGLSGIIGLIPGIGDLLDAVLSLYILMRAVQLGVPRVTITRMLVNVGIETVAGMVPFLGAIFDTVFKANRRNYQLLKSRVSAPRRQTSKDWLFLIIVAVIVVAGIAVPIMLLLELAKRL